MENNNSCWTPAKVSQHNDELFLSKRDILRVSDCHFITVATDPVEANIAFSTRRYPNEFTILQTDAYLSTKNGQVNFKDDISIPYLSEIAMTKEEGVRNHEAVLKKIQEFVVKTATATK